MLRLRRRAGEIIRIGDDIKISVQPISAKWPLAINQWIAKQ